MRCVSSAISHHAGQRPSGERLTVGALCCFFVVAGGCYEPRAPQSAPDPSCAGCHGEGDDNLAPPPGIWLDGSKTETTERGVGAHQAHFVEGDVTLAIPCGTCHVVPEAIGDPGHIDPSPAEVVFSGLALARGVGASWDGERCTSYCHTSRLPEAEHPRPEWTLVDGSQSGCDGCHGSPPGGSHPANTACSNCHGDVVDDQGQIIDKSLHLNGTVEVSSTGACNSCHGSEDNDAPPVDTIGNSEQSARGVGLHQAHVRDTTLHAAYDCDVCHVVPEAVDDPGHIDTPLPAEVTFGDLARGDLRSPGLDIDAKWDTDALTCTVYCHGLDGGGRPEPGWIAPEPMVCGGCHGLPPENTLSGGTHPDSPLNGCAGCHRNVVNAAGEIIDPTLHANGKVDF